MRETLLGTISNLDTHKETIQNRFDGSAAVIKRSPLYQKILVAIRIDPFLSISTIISFIISSITIVIIVPEILQLRNCSFPLCYTRRAWRGIEYGRFQFKRGHKSGHFSHTIVR